MEEATGALFLHTMNKDCESTHDKVIRLLSLNYCYSLLFHSHEIYYIALRMGVDVVGRSITQSGMGHMQLVLCLCKGKK